jgi:hypothetical protein
MVHAQTAIEMTVARGPITLDTAINAVELIEFSLL